MEVRHMDHRSGETEVTPLTAACFKVELCDCVRQ